MEQYTIKPFLSLYRPGGPTRIKPNVLAELEKQITATLKRKFTQPAQTPSALAELRYLEILNAARTALGSQKMITIKDFEQQVNEYIVQRKYNFHEQKHTIAHPRMFWHNTARQHENYDLAYYHPSASKINRHYHHRESAATDSAVSVFYFRVERQHQKILFGNLQIDDKIPANWVDPSLGKTLLGRKNAQLTMVQAAVRHALKQRIPEIIFQAGSAACYAQFDKDWRPEVKITEENLSDYQRMYQQEQARWENFRPGKVLENRHSAAFLIYARTATTVKLHWINKDISNILYALPPAPRNGNKPEVEIADEIRDLFLTRSPKRILSVLQKGIKVAQVPWQPQRRPEKLDFIENWLRTPAGDQDFLKIDKFISDFYERFGYEELILEKYPQIKRIINPNTRERCYENTEGSFTYQKLDKAQLAPPRLGEYYPISTWESLLNSQNKQRVLKEQKIYNWYEFQLPELLQKLGFSVEKVPLESKRRRRVFNAAGWKIISGLTEFESRPRILV